MVRYQRRDGVLIESVGHLWAAFTPISGETSLLNDECAAILDVLLEGPADTTEVCVRLAADCELLASDIHETVEASWRQLVEVGAVERVGDSSASLL